MKIALTAAATISAFLLVLTIPAGDPPVADAPEHGAAFIWNQDSLWTALEAEYARARTQDCSVLSGTIETRIASVHARATQLLEGSITADDPLFDTLETDFFRLAPRVAACPHHTGDYIDAYRKIREGTKLQSRHWNVNDLETRRRLYRTLYGGRAALEEVMLQHPDEVPTLIPGTNEPSATPFVEINGLEVHSGDILASRGGYPTSALISRGSDYPGNFSHIALVHVDEESGEASIIEAHIEVGVAVATADDYLRDKKLRIMVLRPRADLPALVADPLLPHRAAGLALDRARSGHIPYDFEMDYTDPSRLFCSEVASAAYRDVGVELWMGMSTITDEGLRRWLSSFGVRHFETQEPSDLEYDPQLTVVAEWRDPETLFKDHVDNAVIDAMLEGAARGDEIDYPWYRLAPARILKAYSWIRTEAGSTGPIPEGMDPSAALRNTAFTEWHQEIAGDVLKESARFESERGYPPPYWQLLEMARADTK